MIKITIVGEDGDAEALATEHEPDDAQLPILEAVYVRVRMVVKVHQRTGGNQGFAPAVAGGEEERNVGDLLGQDVDGAINPDHLLIGIGKNRGRGLGLVAAQPAFWGKG